MAPLLPVLILAAVLSACGSGQIDSEGRLIVENPYEPLLQDEGRPLSFTLEQTYGSEEEPVQGILEYAGWPAIDDQGNVYILDGRHIVSFAPDGGFRWQMAEQGEGPGELNQARGMVLGPDNRLYVNNQSSRRLDVYDLEGAHIRAISPESFGHDRFTLIGFVDDSTAVGTTDAPGILGTRIVVLDVATDWRVRNEFLIDQTGDIDMPQGMSAFATVELLGDTIMVGNVKRYEIALMSTTGDTLRIVRREVADFVGPGFASGDNMIGMRMFSALNGLAELPSGHFLIRGRWPTNVTDPDAVTTAAFGGDPPDIRYHSTLDIYDADWRLIYSIEGEELEELALGNPAFVSPDGLLYMRQHSPYPRLARYRVHVD